MFEFMQFPSYKNCILACSCYLAGSFGVLSILIVVGKEISGVNYLLLLLNKTFLVVQQTKYKILVLIIVIKHFFFLFLTMKLFTLHYLVFYNSWPNLDEAKGSIPLPVLN